MSPFSSLGLWQEAKKLLWHWGLRNCSSKDRRLSHTLSGLCWLRQYSLDFTIFILPGFLSLAPAQGQAGAHARSHCHIYTCTHMRLHACIWGHSRYVCLNLCTCAWGGVEPTCAQVHRHNSLHVNRAHPLAPTHTERDTQKHCIENVHILT